MFASSLRINRRISAPQVRLIGANGLPVGIVNLQTALKAADDAGLDLVEVSPKADPPVAKILDYGKLQYEEGKKKRKARQDGMAPAMKEVRMRPKIDTHDLEFKTRHAMDFLRKGHRVKVTVQFSGREITHQQIGYDLVQKMRTALNGYGIGEGGAKLEGRNLSLILKPVAA